MSFEKGHALVIGLGSFAKVTQLNNVPSTAEDARRLAALLSDERYCAYPPTQVKLLTDVNATSQNILAELEALANISKDDTVLIFYSGHGVYGDDGYYLTSHDTLIENNKVVPKTGVLEKKLLERLNKIPAERALLIFNACHSGEISPDALGSDMAIGMPVPTTLTTGMLGTGKGRVVITACKEDQRSYFVKTDPTTLFAQIVIDTLQGNSVVPRRGYISVFDLYDAVYSKVSKEVKDRWDLQQDPVLTVHRGVGVMAIALYKGSTQQEDLGPQDRPASLGQVAREVEPEDSGAILQQILSGEINLAAGRDIIGNTVVGKNQYNTGGDTSFVKGNQYKSEGDMLVSDRIDARRSQGFINHAPGLISQNFGSEANINTGGGDYAGGNIDKRQGNFISGGTVTGSLVGVNNNGIVTTNLGGATTSEQSRGPSLREARKQLRNAIDAAVAQGENDVSAALDDIEQSLDTALRAEGAGDSVQRGRKLRQAQGDLDDLAVRNPSLQSLAQLLKQVPVQ